VPDSKPQRLTLYRRYESTILGAGTMTVLIAVWQFVWSMGWISPLFLSGPSAMLKKFVELSASGQLGSNALYSGTNFFLGFALAIAVGVPAGILLGWYRRALAMFDPLINALYATPRIALYPLIIIWFGIGSGSKIFVVFLSAMLPIMTNTIAGVRNLDPDLLRAARAFCASDRQIFRTVAVPYSLPFIAAGVRQGVAHGLIGIIIAEMSAGNQGIGFMISYAGQTFATDTLMVGVSVIGISGLVLSWGTARVQRYFERWRPRDIGRT
jgi:ABC-type nitrate/sulfonate/bicarbonate transport system permease component